jgi:hypothetical protein
VAHGPDIERLDASYDEAGSVTIAVTFHEPKLAELSFRLAEGRTGEQEPEDDRDDCADCSSYSAPDFTGSVSPPIAFSDGWTYPGYAAGRLDGFGGAVETQPTLSPNGRTLTVSFGHTALANRNWRCVTVSMDSYNDAATLFFAGYEPKALTPETAAAEAEAYLAGRFGQPYAKTPRKWLKCPAEEIFRLDEGEPPMAVCQYEFQMGRRFRGGGFVVRLRDNTLSVEGPWQQTYTKTLKRCGRVSATKRGARRVRFVNRRLSASGMPGCRYVSSFMAGDVEYEVARRFPRPPRSGFITGLRGTNKAGFEEWAVFTCQARSRKRGSRRAYTVVCANKLEGSFRYSFTAYRQPRRSTGPSRPSRPSRPEPSRSRCNPNYEGACLPLRGDVDCSEISERNFRSVGSDPFRLDSDDDGVACES